MKRLGIVLLVVGAILVVWGCVSLGRMVGAEFEEQQGYVASTLYPLVVGIWLIVGGAFKARR